MIRDYYNRLKKWLSNRQPTNRETLILGSIGSLVTTAFLAAVAFVLAEVSVVDPAEQLPIWVAVALAVVASIVGFAGGALFSQGYYKPQIKALSAEAVLERERRERIEPDAEAQKRLVSYVDHFCLLLEDISDGKVAMSSDFVEGEISDAVQETLCEIPQALLREAADIDVKVSVWAEQTKLVRAAKLEVVRAPDHTQSEAKKFSVRRDKSWMHLAQEHQSEDPERDRVLRIDDLSIAGFYGEDLEQFRECGYQSVRVVPFDVGGEVGRLVFLSPQPLAFSVVEDRYFVLLRAALNIPGFSQPEMN